MRIRTGDNVLVIAGKERGKTGRIERRFPEQDRVSRRCEHGNSAHEGPPGR